MSKEYNFRTIKLEDMMEYIEQNAKEDKDWFKSVAIDENGKYQHLVAVRAFASKYMPHIMPVAKKKVKKSDLLANW